MLELKAQKREILGKNVKTLRQQGFVPAELYGHGKENAHLSVNEKEFNKVFKEAGESTIITLSVEKEKVPVLIYDAAFDPLAQKVSHIDFFAVKMDEKIITEIPLEFTGESMAVKSGGVLVKSMSEVEVESLPADLPSHIEVNLSVLENIHDAIHVKDLKVSNKVKILVDEDNVIATVVEPSVEEETTTTTVEDVKVEGEEKKKEAE